MLHLERFLNLGADLTETDDEILIVYSNAPRKLILTGVKIGMENS